MLNLHDKSLSTIFKRLVFIFFLTALSASHVYSQDFTIKRFFADITIHEDASITIQEKIVVKFHAPRHGIYREIPYKFTDERGNTVKTPLHVLSVTDNEGEGWKYRTRKKGNIMHIRIGDPDKYVKGLQTYMITYKVNNALLFFDDHDELYWNVTGNYWLSPIYESSANVILAVSSESQNLWASCYTGYYGSRASDCSYELSRNSAVFFTKKRLQYREGFTVAFGWDKGLINPPSKLQKFLWMMDLRENWIFSVPILTLIIMLYLWQKRGRDPKVRDAITVKYNPPAYNNITLSPAEVGTLIDERLDSRDITSTIVGLAVRGYLKIEESKTEGLIFDSVDYYLVKVKDPDDTITPFEKELMNKIFQGGLPGIMVSDMKNKFYKNLDILKDTLYSELLKKKYFLVRPDEVRKVYLFAGIILIVLLSILFSILIASGKGIIAGILSGVPVLLFSRIMPAKSKLGSLVYMDILGFQEFMSRAEKEKLERIGDKELFSKFLPYAVALDVVDNWAKAFEGIYQEPPQWYISTGGGRTFSPHGFSRSIQAATTSLSSAMFSAPRGSGISSGSGGFGGGGFSGGGFGGGGGGSW